MHPPFDAIRDALERHQDIYITTHVGPDADAIGPALALKGALEARGKRVVYVSRDGVPHSSRFIARSDEVLLSPPPDFRPELAFVLDCDGTASRVASPMEPIEQARERILIDHHRSSTPIFDINWIDPNQPATAMMIYELLLELDLPIDEEMAEGLLAGLSCDTGHFRFSNTSPPRSKWPLT
jgi:phosphoesterase RecJ-like protein